jgi:peroxiredoxin
MSDDGDVGLAVGSEVPDVGGRLVRPDGPTADVRLDELLADGPVLLSFYTADFSPDCVEEWCSFRDFDWFASGETVRVVGVSKSGPRLHRQFIDRLGLQFPLYADTDLDIAAAFGVDYRAFGLVRRSRRSCFLLDADGVVRYKWVGDHWLDPTRDTPPVGEIYDAVRERLDLDAAETETFGFGD